MCNVPEWFQCVDFKDQTPDMLIDQETVYADHRFLDRNDDNDYSLNTTSWDD